ncbi:MAG: hypothetical protein OEY41_02045 [Acidimicrobiia bacterium]|nr:hypothetical protein [Acidimicrobiia bacterium]MDH5288758.1 hypothetical protein [Acidimicrobiia bacterium]
MTPVAIAVAAAGAVALGAMIWVVYVLFDIGSDGLGAGPWSRPDLNQVHSRLPADFIGLWSLFGSRSINALAGSRESAVRRLDRLEAHLRGLPYDADAAPGTTPVPADFSDGWLEARLDLLERLAGLQPAGAPSPYPGELAPEPGRAAASNRPGSGQTPTPHQPARGQR